MEQLSIAKRTRDNHHDTAMNINRAGFDVKALMRVPLPRTCPADDTGTRDTHMATECALLMSTM
jgi:hypothetical protein